MPTPPSAARLLAAVSRVLQRGGWRWYVFGAQAVNVHGRPRMTADVDVTVELERAEVPRFCTAMKKAGFTLRVAHAKDFVRATSVLPFVHRATEMPLDVVLAGSGLEALFLERASSTDIGGLEVPVIDAADLVVAKTLAGRPKDLEDVEGILRTQAKSMDISRVRALLIEVEIALGQSDLLPLLDRAIAHARARRTDTRPRSSRIEPGSRRPTRKPHKATRR